MVEICDYSDTDYKKSFWDEGTRIYEDKVERYALRKLFPEHGGSIIDIGAGFGRLMDEYSPRFEKVTVLDYAANLLKQAEERAGQMGYHNVEICQGNVYELSQESLKYDYAMSVRVMHHVEDAKEFFSQVNAILKPGGYFILEYANKRNFLEIMRQLLGREHLSPFAYEPSQRGDSVYYNFHPSYINDLLKQCGFEVEKELMVSLFRSNFIKEIIGPATLSYIENYIQEPLGSLKLSPSVFVKARKKNEITEG